MLRLRLAIGVLIGIGAFAHSASSSTIELPTPAACPVVEGLALAAEEEKEWTACEKWAWSCIRQGREANLFAHACVGPRSDEAGELRDKHVYAPFYQPDRYKDSSGIGARFLYAILTKRQYSEAIPPVGVRLVGAYFAETVNLENVSTDKNLVLDQSIFKKGLRFTNFRSEKNLSLDGSNVRAAILLLRAQIDGSLFLENGVYDLVNATDARVGGSIDAPSSIFNAPVRLDRVKVDGKVSFVRARLTELTAWDTNIGSKLELRFADVRGRIDLTGTSVNGDLRMQRLQFGRALVGDARLSCDWSLKDWKNTLRFFLSPDQPELRDNPQIYDEMLEEAVRSRPEDPRSDYPCLKITDKKTGAVVPPTPYQHEVLLRDMKVGGGLCLIEVTGKIEGPPGAAESGPSRNITAIYLDGTQAQSTILRWAQSDSETLWQAVHFTTKNLYIDLNSQPKQHFLDNLKIEHISFIKPGAPDQEAEEQREESRAYLCDIRPGPRAHVASDAPETHQRIIDFFTVPANKSKSTQPFGEVVARLNDSNASSMSLKMALSEFTLAKVCSSSNLFSGTSEAEGAPDGGRGSKSGKVKQWLNFVTSEVGGLDVDETRNIVLDSACFGGLKAYKYSVAYGHQPHNILLLIAIFVLLFRLLLAFDKPAPGAGELGKPAPLGLLYSIDMFTPFVKLNPHHVGLVPNRRALRAYLLLHRVVGLVLTSFLAIGIYAARF